MAFDRPLEADRVDDLNLFSVFLRAPVVGTLLWWVAGDKAKRQQLEEDEERRKMQDLLERGGGDGGESSNPSKRSAGALSGSCGAAKKSKPTKSVLKKSKGGPPGMVPSEVSVDGCVGECSEALEDLSLGAQHVPSSLKGKKKELSWSDESGHDLVEFIGYEVRIARLCLVVSSLLRSFLLDLDLLPRLLPPCLLPGCLVERRAG